jgi:hypothetical protein
LEIAQMQPRPNIICRAITPLTAVILVVAVYFPCRQPVLSQAESGDLAGRFAFSRTTLPVVEGYEQKVVREVHPSLSRISSWVSSICAAVALADLDGDGLPNDLAYVDPRINQVIVTPAPGSPPRYQPFVLDPSPLPFDPVTTAFAGCLIGDFNEDGLPDILTYFWGRTPAIFVRQSAPQNSPALSGAAYIPCELVPGGARWFTSAATQADFDGDGHLDLLFGNYFPDGASIFDPHATGAESVQNTMAKSFSGGRKHFLLWERAPEGQSATAKFREVEGVLEEQVSRGWTLAAGAIDLDGDLLPEIYLANDFGPDRLLHNRSTPGELQFAVVEGDRTYATPKSCVLGKDSFKGMGLDFADLNGDGVPDIYVSNIAREFGLQESHFQWLSTGDAKSLLKQGVAPYRHGSEELGLSRSGWGWDCRLADFDNDGALEAIQATGFIKGEINRWPELQSLAVANSQLLDNPQFWPRFQPGDDLSGGDLVPFFVRAADGRFYNIGPRLGFDAGMVTRGISLADIDGDGRLDFALANQWGPSFFYHNDCPAPGAFLGLHLVLPLDPSAGGSPRVVAGHPDESVKGRPAIGAHAKVFLPGGRFQVNEVDGGTGHSGKRSPDLHFGLGRHPEGEKLKVELRWRDPDGNVCEAEVMLAPGWHTIVLPWTKA